MQIKEENPPFQILYKCEKAFDLTLSLPIFTVGDTIYNPHKCKIDEFLLAHESVHTLQQGDDPAKWWNRYLEDKDFRYEQELEAFRVQYRVTKECIKDRNLAARFLFAMSSDLASPMYGKMCHQGDAFKAIKKDI